MRLGFVLLAVPLALSACSHTEQCPAPNPAFNDCKTQQGSPFTALFDPFGVAVSNQLNPFPNPVFAVNQPFKSYTTGYQPNVPGEYGQVLDTLDGFGNYAPIFVSFNDIIDPVSLPQVPQDSLSLGSPVFVVDLEKIRADPTVPFADVAWPVTAWYNNGPANTLAVAPWVPFVPEREYAFVMTDTMATYTDAAQTTQKCIAPSETFNCVKNGSTVASSFEPMRQELVPLFNWLELQGVDRGRVTLALNFVTESAQQELLNVRAQVRNSEPPVGHIDQTRVFHDIVSPTTGQLSDQVYGYFQTLFPPDANIQVNLNDYSFDQIGTIAYGFFPSVDFRQPEYRLFITDGTDGQVEPEGVNDLEFLLVEPKPDPANHIGPPYKTVIFQHALTVCKETMVAVANEFARRNMAMIGIDIVAHGSRSAESAAAGHELCEISALEFLTLSNPLNAREGFRQTVADQYQLVDMVENLQVDLDGDGINDLDTSKIGYVSQSLGSIIGGTLMATEPDVGAAVLNVGGGGLYNIALSFFGFGSQTGGPDGFIGLEGAEMNLVLVAQTALDRADPINYANHVVNDPFVYKGVPAKPKSILLQQAVNDGVVANYSTDALTMQMACGPNIGLTDCPALAGPSVFRSVPGLSVINGPVTGNVAGGAATLAEAQFSPANHSFLLTQEHPGSFCRGQIQAASFMHSWFYPPAGSTTGAPTIIDAYTDPETAGCPLE